jgi:hypothetical protein
VVVPRMCKFAFSRGPKATEFTKTIRSREEGVVLVERSIKQWREREDKVVLFCSMNERGFRGAILVLGGYIRSPAAAYRHGCTSQQGG